ncbi:MAG: homocysteine S-methyltransferase family protein [Clostridia bacterium]|nr:homocysteine S-methyltransferase family protein [Clostridia bacterium]
MKITEYIKQNTVYLDGGMGTLLQARGLAAGELPERWNITHSDIVTGIHKSYYDAGSNVVNTNTFGANILKFSHEELEEIVKSAIDNVRAAMKQSEGEQPKWVALDIGPTGRMLAPYGDFDFEEAVSVFSETVRLGARYGADLVFIETMNDSYETKAALLAAKENCDLPVFVSNAYGEDGKLMTGADPYAMVAMLEGMGADAVGVNCSLGPQALRPVVEKYIECASVPVMLKPNAGLPKVKNGRTVYDVAPDEFAADVSELVRLGVRAAGGCCGTTPEYISAVVRATKGITPLPLTSKNITCVSSYTHAIVFGDAPVLIGERINPTGKKRFKEALKANDMDYILKEGIAQEEKGVHILDVNVGLPDIDEVRMLKNAVCELQAIIDLPLQIDTSDAVAMETALRRYNGKAMINSVNGKRESMDAVFPLAKKYGGLIVALTLDESGIPADAQGRLAIAEKILTEAEKYGIDKKDIIFDPLALTISADNKAAAETLRAVEMIKTRLGCHTSLGVSNVSFGLPERDIITSSFFALALGRGLSAAIMNPYSAEMMKTYFAYRALAGLDDNCAGYIEFAQNMPKQETVTVSAGVTAEAKPSEYKSELQRAVVKGLKDRAAELTAQLIGMVEPLRIVQEEIIPALDIVGEGFEKKTVYLPQLLMSAEAAKSAFEKIKSAMPGDKAADKCRFVIATVKGDIHDIGKNIVKLLLENYGFDVTDLGRDVSPEEVVETVINLKAPVAGLSALMTTTVPAMEDTVRLLHERAPWCKVVVGGAVLNPEYAEQIGADKYAKDAMETVRYAEEINNSLN